MRQAIYHALYPKNPCYERQWIQSVRSIRRHNQDIPVYLFHYGEPSDQVCDEIDGSNIHLVVSNYDELLRLTPLHIANVIRRYPVIHKFKPLHLLPYDSLLYLDCDTYFFADPALIFERYSKADFYAKVEPCTLRAYPDGAILPYSAQVDAHMKHLTDVQGWPEFPPYNLGACLWNHCTSADCGDATPFYFETLYNFLCDLHRRDPDWEYGIGAHGPGLPYPPAGMIEPWVVEQVSLWYSWAHLGLRHEPFKQQDVSISLIEIGDPRPVLAHYFHLSEDQFFREFV